MENLVLLCRSHHRLVHEAGYGIQLAAGKVAVFSLPNGNIIPQGPDRRSCGSVSTLITNNHKQGVEITANTSIPKWYGDQMDHGMAVEALLQCE